MSALVARSSSSVFVRFRRNLIDDKDTKTIPLDFDPEATVADYLPSGMRNDPSVRVFLEGQLVDPSRLNKRKAWRGATIELIREPGTTAIPLIMAIGITAVQYASAWLQSSMMSTPPSPPEESRYYGSLEIDKSDAKGAPVQIAYGAGLVTGLIIDRRIYSGAEGIVFGPLSIHSGDFMTQILAAFGEGPWQEIGGHTAPTGKLYLPSDAPSNATLYESDRLLVNGNPVRDVGVKGYVAFRLGRNNQTALPGQIGTFDQRTVGTQFRFTKHPEVTTWWSQTVSYTTENRVHGLSLVFSFPNGVYGVDKGGGYYEEHFSFYVSVKPHGAPSWTILNAYHGTRALFMHPDVIELRIDFEQIKGGEALYGSIVDVDVFMVFGQAPWINRPHEVSLHSVIEFNKDTAFNYPNTVLAEIVMAGEGMTSAIDSVSAYGQCCEVWLEDDLDHEPSFTWTGNPAHVFKDYVCSLKGGGNEFALENVHRGDLLEWANYCDERVSDGKGGSMRRWETFYIVDGQKGFRDHLTALCSAGRASHYWDGKQIRIAIDRESDPVNTYSMFGHGNIKAGTFKISEIPIDNRPNAVDVTFLNEDEDFVSATATWKDHDRIRVEGLRSRRVTIPVKSWAQAAAIAHYLVNVATFRTTMIEFEASVGAGGCRPGEVIAVHHDAEGFDGISGRLVLDTPGGGLGIYLDQPITITDETAPPTIGVITTGTGSKELQVRTIVSGPGVFARGALLQVSPSFDAGDLPKKYCNYVAGWDAGYGIGPAKPYLVTGVTRVSDLSVKISAVNYDERVFQDDPTGVVPKSKIKPVTKSTLPPVPSKLEAETLPGRGIGGHGRTKMIRVSWKNGQHPWPVLSWVYVRCETTSEPWGVHRYKAYGEWYDFENPLDGLTYEFAISPISTDGAFFRAPQRSPTIKVKTGRRAAILPPRVP